MHVIGTAGHVDHGKSTLVQRLTGIDPDRFAEEKRRGLTIDLGFAWFTLPSGEEVGMVDVPGHERFIANMLAGAGGITVCMFVVAANEGWMPQSAEHLTIVDLLGISHGVVALTKSDSVDADTLELRLLEVEEKLAASSLKDARVVPCSAVSGDGIDELVNELDRVLGSAPPPEDLGRPRLWVDRVFTVAGAGTVVTGTSAGGTFASGDEVEISPEGRRARIRKIQSHKKGLSSVGPGTRTALNLAGLERQGAERGDAIVTAGAWKPTRELDVMLRVAGRELLGVEHELTSKGSHLLHVGSAETPVRVALLENDTLRSGEQGLARLYLRDPLPLARGDRFVLRDAGRRLTFGGGSVLDPFPPKGRRSQRATALHSLVGASPGEAAAAIVELEGSIDRATLRLRTGSDEAPTGAVTLGDDIYSALAFETLSEKARQVVDEHHSTHPLEPGIDRETLRNELGFSPSAFEDLVARLGLVTLKNRIAAAEHQVALDPEQQRARDALIGTLRASGVTPPMTKELGVSADLLRSLTESGELVRVGDFHLEGTVATEIRSKVRSAIESQGPITVAQIRDLLGTTRKYAVPLCEWLDDTGATIRRGDVRHLGPRA